MIRTSTRPRKGSPLNVESPRELFKRSSKLVRRNIWIFGPLYGYQMLFLLNSWISDPSKLSKGFKWQFEFQNHNFGWIVPAMPPYSWGFFLTIGFTSLTFLIISVVVQLMTVSAQLDAAQHQHLDFIKLWQQAKTHWREIVKVYACLGAVILVPSLGLIMLGHSKIGLLVLVILAAITAQKYLFAPYVIIEQNVSYQKAMHKSLKISRTNPGAIWSVIIIGALIGLTSFIPIIGGLLSFGLAFLFAAAPAMRYEQLKRLAA
jgi:uncharacterized membrane protein